MNDVLIPTQKLREYISHVKNLEVIRYQEIALLQSVESKLYFAKQNYRKINNSFIDVPKEPSLSTKIGSSLGSAIGFGIMGIIISVVIVIALMVSYIIPVINIPALFIVGFIDLKGLGVFQVAGYFVCIIGIISCALGFLIGKSDSSQKAYNEKVMEIEEKNGENQKKLSNIRQRVQILSTEVDKIKAALAETENTLQLCYQHNIIYSKYRNLVAVCMFEEYLSSGRCTALTGHEGAYNIYENEIRLNLIITKLDDIINRLDEIQENQYQLAHEIRMSAQKISKIGNSIDEHLENIEYSTQLSTYLNGISALNSSYLVWLSNR